MDCPPSPSSSTSSFEKFFSLTAEFETAEVSTDRKDQFLEIVGDKEDWSSVIVDNLTKLTIVLEESLLGIFLVHSRDYPEFICTHHCIEDFWEPVFSPRSGRRLN